MALIRRGQHGAFEALVQRYQPRLLAFCRHMLGSQEDAEDVLQEVFAASFNAICADERPINARPWLYRIARNRCLNHLRRPQPAGQDSMDVFERDGGATTADTVHKREEFRHLVSDVQDLPETQRTALLLREIDALSYDQIAEAMVTTVPSVKSLLVRARVSLAEASEARLLTCDEVRLELGKVAEGLVRSTAPVRRHLRGCDRCRTFRVELRKTTRALAAIYPVGPLLFLKKLSLAKLGFGGAAGAAASSGGGAAAGAAGGLAGTAATAAGGFTAGGALSAGAGTIASKAAAGVAAAVIVTAGAVEVKHATTAQPHHAAAQVAVAAPQVVAPVAPAAAAPQVVAPASKATAAAEKPEKREKPAEPKQATVAPAPQQPADTPAEQAAQEPAPARVQEGGSTVTLPPQDTYDPDPATPPSEGSQQGPPPGEANTTSPQQPPPAPPAGEPQSTALPPAPAPPPGE